MTKPTFGALKEGDVIRTVSGRYRKIYPKANDDRRGAKPYNVIQLDPAQAAIHPNLWRCPCGHGQKAKTEEEIDAIRLELAELGLSPVYGTFASDFSKFELEQKEQVAV